MSRAALRLIIAAACLIGIVLAGALAPAVGISTPIPDLGVDEESDGALGEELLVEDAAHNGDGQPADGNGEAGEDPNGESSGGEFIDDPAMDDEGSPAASGSENYGGVSAGGYPEESTVGGPLALSDHEELYIESSEPSRWRLGAYSTYTGDGWSRDEGESEPLEEPLSTVDGTTGPTSEIRVTPQRSFESLATAWRPESGTAPGRQVLVTEERGLKVSEPVTAGETYVTTTYGPPSHTTAASASGTEAVPADIRAQYTQLPAETPDRLEEHTDSITSDAETPYENAAAVQRWLKENKEYSLDADHDRNADVATEFVFEMEAGYCEYFATSMVAMLRTQDVPARYVTGYGPGEQVGEDEYLVRGQHAHAWVEVYIADVGWVTFDPTPGDGRSDAGRDDVSPEDAGPDPNNGDDGPVDDDADAPDEEREEHADTPPEAEETQPEEDDADLDETSEDAEEDPQEADDQQQDDESETDPAEEAAPLEIELAEDPIPGQELTVTVARDDDPVSGVEVLFNNASVGDTDAAGNVTGEVPYTDSLEITAQEGESGAADVNGAASFPGAAAPASGTDPVFNRLSGGLEQDSERSDRFAPEMDGNVTVDVPTDIEIDVRGEPIAGEPVDIVATVSDVPVSNATVQFDGTEVARTTSAGEVTAALPENDTVAVDVSRGDATGNQTVSVSTFEVTTRPSTIVALPLTTVTATATLDEDPVTNATVLLDGEPVAVTGADGTAEVDLPLTDATTVEATAAIDGTSPTATTTVSNLYRNLALLIGAFTIGMSAIGVKAKRSGVSVRSLSRAITRSVVRAVRMAVAGLVGAAGTVETVLKALRRGVFWSFRLGIQGISGIRRLLRAGVRGTRRSVDWGRKVILSVGRRLHPLAIIAALRRFVRGIRDGAARGLSSETQRDEPQSAGGDVTDGEEVLTLREVWMEFRRYVSIRSWRTSTPGEIARWAIQKDGLPPEPVQTITNGFRDVEYGSRSATDRAPAAREALMRLRRNDRDAEDTELEEGQ